MEFTKWYFWDIKKEIFGTITKQCKKVYDANLQTLGKKKKEKSHFNLQKKSKSGNFSKTRKDNRA